jgi:F0F1-type ATP synthase assembly protein I
MTKEIQLASIERTQWFILALFTLGSLAFWEWRITLGVIIGGGICILNFKALRMIIERGFTQGKGARSIFAQYATKVLLLLAVVAGVVILLRDAVNLIAFLVGLLTVFVAIVVAGIRGYRYTGQEEANDGT